DLLPCRNSHPQHPGFVIVAWGGPSGRIVSINVMEYLGVASCRNGFGRASRRLFSQLTKLDQCVSIRGGPASMRWFTVLTRFAHGRGCEDPEVRVRILVLKKLRAGFLFPTTETVVDV